MGSDLFATVCNILLLCYWLGGHRDQEKRETETREVLISNSCFFAAEKSRFTEEQSPKGNKQFLITVRGNKPRD